MTADFQHLMLLIRHRLDQITRPLFQREDVEELLTEIVRLRAREQLANDRAEEELYRMNDLLGTMIAAREKLEILVAENEALQRLIAELRREMEPGPYGHTELHSPAMILEDGPPPEELVSQVIGVPYREK